MSWRVTQQAAVICGWHLWMTKYDVKTIINVGVGSAPEIKIWKWLFPKVKIVGIDARYKRVAVRGGADFIHAAVSDGTHSTSRFCQLCHAVKCRTPEKMNEHVDLGAMIDVPAVSLDEVASAYESPYFIWMDIEGAEHDALNGGAETLKRTGWINTELYNYHVGHKKLIHGLLLAAGFLPVFKHATDDILYAHTDLVVRHRLRPMRLTLD